MFRVVLFTLLSVVISASAMASESLSAADIKVLFSNKTFDIHNVVKDKKLKGYDSEDGEHLVYIPWKDKISKRKWWIEGNKHCTNHPKRGDSCKLVTRESEGVYHGVTDGKHTHTLSNFREGNQL